jgi:hypothetical protein
MEVEECERACTVHVLSDNTRHHMDLIRIVFPQIFAVEGLMTNDQWKEWYLFPCVLLCLPV